MTPTREELELVAKAAGIDVEWHPLYEQFFKVGRYRNGAFTYLTDLPWSPCSDLGDSRRLQVALGIDLQFNLDSAGKPYTVTASTPDGEILATEFYSDHPTPDEAACAAVFRCALAVALEKEGEGK